MFPHQVLVCLFPRRDVDLGQKSEKKQNVTQTEEDINGLGIVSSCFPKKNPTSNPKKV